MKRRVFALRTPQHIIDYRNDDLLLSALETEIKLASRFFTIVDFITENIEPDKDDPESESDKVLMAQLGNFHWQRARRIIKQRRELIEAYGQIPGDDEDVPQTSSHSSK